MKVLTRTLGLNLFEGYYAENVKRVFVYLERNKDAKFLDLGCSDGKRTLEFAKQIHTKHIFGLDAVLNDIKKARKLGIKCTYADLNTKFPYKSNTFDVVLSHFSIEHLVNMRSFTKECFRVLKPGGYIVIASDNLNAWLNIGAMILTYQPFSLTRGLSDKTVGNPFAFWNDKEVSDYILQEDDSLEGTGSHIKVMSTRAAVDVIKNVGFSNIQFTGAGYFPFFGWLSDVLSKIDPYHSHFYILKAKKPHK